MKWINITEQLPPLDTGVLVTDGKYIICCEFGHFGELLYPSPHNFSGHEWEWDYIEIPKISKWMPLPELPDENN